ncbi:hypothetical protein CMI47_10155 [Candidatus Pacearchaeota archaeon]|nr:hypothetical protein [Candidatus Pacearchaeota archaeon]|tara:strand:- start:6069 stop:6347 length:279 start_codon:yes stop_codon:yes gene_type:complete
MKKAIVQFETMIPDDTSVLTLARAVSIMLASGQADAQRTLDDANTDNESGLPGLVTETAAEMDIGIITTQTNHGNEIRVIDAEHQALITETP